MPGSGGMHEEIINFDLASETLKNVTLTGNEIEDDITVGFREEIKTTFRTIFMGIDGSSE